MLKIPVLKSPVLKSPVLKRPLWLAGIALCITATCTTLPVGAAPPRRPRPAPSSTGTSTGTTAPAPASATQLLTASAAALAQAKSYQYDGSALVNFSTPVGKQPADQRYSEYGAWSRPSNSYCKLSLNPSSSQKAGALEVFATAGALYVKTDGGVQFNGATAHEWIDVGSIQSPSSMGTPLANIQMLTRSSGTVTSAPDESLNGKNYRVLKAKLTGEAARALLGSILVTVEKQINMQSRGKSSGQTEATVTYYIDPTTLIAEVARYTGTETVTAMLYPDGTTTGAIDAAAEAEAARKKEAQKSIYAPKTPVTATSPTKKATASMVTVTLKIDGDISLRDLNQPVTMPDVTGAQPLPRGKSRQEKPKETSPEMSPELQQQMIKEMGQQ